MDRLRKLLRLSSGERWLLTKVSLLLCMVKLGLVSFPFEALRRVLRRLVKLPTSSLKPDGRSAEQVVWAVETSGNLLPRARTCLTKALTVQVLLHRRGLPARLHIGAVRGDDGQFLAHAWVESEGRVIIGGYELDRYTRLVTLEGELDEPSPDRLADGL